MRLPRMTKQRWLIVTAVFAVLCWGTLRAQALERRAAFHAREKQSCLQRAQGVEGASRPLLQEHKGRFCGPTEGFAIFAELEEACEAAPELRERAAYHAELEVSYRRASRYPWIQAPAEKPFKPDDRIRSPEWLRAKAEAYKSLESDRRDLAKSFEELRKPKQAEEQLRIAEEDARTAAVYDRRARQVRGIDGLDRWGGRAVRVSSIWVGS
jgi:hypothetical protein